MSNQGQTRLLKWQQDLDLFDDSFGGFIIDGNIDDLQPCPRSDGRVDYVPICDYLTHKYYTASDDRKCVVVYDLTENIENRFDIRMPYDEVTRDSVSDNRNGGGGENDTPETVHRYSDRMAQRFYDIAHDENDEFDEMFLKHSASGVSLDLALMHYALNEGSRNSRMRDWWENLFNAGGSTRGYLFIIKMTSRLLTTLGARGSLSADERNDFVLLEQLLNAVNIQTTAEDGNGRSRLDHKVILLCDKAVDLPEWFVNKATKLGTKLLTVTRPTVENKTAFFESLITDNCFSDEFIRRYNALDVQGKKNVSKRFLAYTDDMTMQSLLHYRTYLETNGDSLVDPDKISYSLMEFTTGVQHNPWENPETRAAIFRISETAKEVIKGQDDVLNQVQNIMNRAVIGLNRINNPNAPRAVLFLAGPTGTGKTEICKQLAEIVFGRADKMVRLDMSEYQQDHSDQKLFGAPPGYVGYEEGGKLTNAVKKEPFSLILFDEIEKAAPSILDKFLQILGDGRLTDGHGDTVSFTDCIIAMTSNAGITAPVLTPEEELHRDESMDGEQPPEAINIGKIMELEKNEDPKKIYDKLKAYLGYNIKCYFKCKLHRPELYGRVAKSIVIYNYISGEAAQEICTKAMDKFNKGALGDLGIRVDTSSAGYTRTRDVLFAQCRTKDVRALGGRGVMEEVDRLYNDSLSAFIAEQTVRGTVLRGRSITCDVSNPTEGKITSNNITWRCL